tara:strand:+ start:1439 stop:1702 length:264 start_codon:yes stop_codon:yes gene_type:complete
MTYGNEVFEITNRPYMLDTRMADMRAAYDLGHKAGVKVVEDYIEDQQDLKLVMERRGGKELFNKYVSERPINSNDWSDDIELSWPWI